MGKTNIPYATKSWSPITGCSPVSEGCAHCFAKRTVERFPKIHNGLSVIPSDDGGFSDVRVHEKRMDEPARWKKPERVFVMPFGDFFHPDIPLDLVDYMWRMMAKCDHHTFIIPTKRIEYAARVLGPSGIGWYAKEEGNVPCPQPNVWILASCENRERCDERIPHLLRTPAAVRGLSLEPMLGLVDLVPFLPPAAFTLGNPAAYEPGFDQNGADFAKAEGGACFATQAQAEAAMDRGRFLPAHWYPEKPFIPAKVYGLAGPVRSSHDAPPDPCGCEKLDAHARLVRLRESYIDWVVVGGESGHGARPCDPAWIRKVVEQCRHAGVPVYVKQGSGTYPGKQYDIPDDLWSVKELPGKESA